jgi:hypothetical protein
MGKLTYDSTFIVDFEDRTLAHLHLVIGGKLRRGESFFFGRKDDPAIGNGRTSIWLQPNGPLVFKFHGSRPPQINRRWIEVLTVSANSPGGLLLLNEPRVAGLDAR